MTARSTVWPCPEVFWVAVIPMVEWFSQTSCSRPVWRRMMNFDADRGGREDVGLLLELRPGRDPVLAGVDDMLPGPPQSRPVHLYPNTRVVFPDCLGTVTTTVR